MIQMKEWLFKAYLHRLYRMLYRRRAGTMKRKEESKRARGFGTKIYLSFKLRSIFTSGNLLSY